VGETGLVLQVPPLGIHFRATRVERTGTGRRSRLVATDRGHRLVVTVDERPCADTMTGMPFPVRVTLDLDGRRLTGCGGETLTVIEGGWRVIRLGDGPVPGGAVLTMAFGRDGRVAGRSACNRYRGAYTLTGEGLGFGPLATTRMACPPPVMATEARFLELVRGVTRVTTGQGRQLRLMAGDRQALVLERVR
jgi:heat shock protein HslJ